MNKNSPEKGGLGACVERNQCDFARTKIKKIIEITTSGRNKLKMAFLSAFRNFEGKNGFLRPKEVFYH